jgi:hypothetical protein
MAIALNFNLGTRTNPDGTIKPFGKLGFQTLHPKVDKYIRTNMAQIERDLRAGKLKDLDGNVVDNHAVIDVYCTVSLVDDSDTVEAVTSYRNSSGGEVEATPDDAASDDDTPFE